MAFVKGGGGFGRVLFGDQVVGGGCGIAQHHVGLTLKKQAVGFGPALGHGHDIIRQTFPDRRGLVAISVLDPHQQAQTGGRGPRVLDHDLEVTVGQRAKMRGRGQISVMDKGEIAPVIGGKAVILPCDGQVIIRVHCGGREQPCLLGRRDQAGIKPQHQIGVRPRAFQLEPRQQRRAIAHAYEFQIAGAFRLEGRFDHRAGAPFGDKAVVGIDHQFGRLGPCLRGEKRGGSKCKILHGILQNAASESVGGVSRPSLRRC